MRRFSANYVYPISGAPIRNGVVVLDSNNCIVEVLNPKGNEKEFASMEFHNGVLVPGFVNAHCHLELSHLKDRLLKLQGIAGFVSQIRQLRGDESADIDKSIQHALTELKRNGTAAVGDICNTADTLPRKQHSNIYFHNFIELFGLNQNDAEDRLNAAFLLVSRFRSNNIGATSLTPHSPYSISEKLWGLIGNELSNGSHAVSIHYGESEQEYLLLKDHSGKLADNFNSLGIPLNLPHCSSPLEVVKRFIPKTSKVLFVHNTFSSQEEVKQLIDHFACSCFVLCPSSNLFIEGRLPDLPMLVEQGAKIALGTDSFASSNTLSVFDQLMILIEKFPTISFAEAIEWATLNGAQALSIDSRLGSFDAGKSPGINLITDFDFKLMKPTAKSRIKRLV